MPRETDASRAKAIVEKLGDGLSSSEEVFAAFAELDALPLDVVRDAMGAWLGPPPDLERLDDATRRAHGLPLRRLHFVTLATERDGDVLEAGDVAMEQLRLAGKSWDGIDREPEERLDEEIEGSFVGTLRRRILADATAPAKPLYDVLTFAEGAGLVFRANTTDVVAWIADGRVETRDRRVRDALGEALAASEPLPAPEREPEPEAPAVATPVDEEEDAAPAPRPKKKAAAGAKKKATAAAAAPKPKKTAAKKKAAAAGDEAPKPKAKKKAAAAAAAAAAADGDKPAPKKKAAGGAKKKAAAGAKKKTSDD